MISVAPSTEASVSSTGANVSSTGASVSSTDASVSSTGANVSSTEAPSTGASVASTEAPSTEASVTSTEAPAVITVDTSTAGFCQLAKMSIEKKDIAKLRQSPSDDIKNAALLLGKTTDEIINMYLKCAQNQPSALAATADAPTDQSSADATADANNKGGRKRSRKHRNRRGSHSKSKRSRRNSRSKSKRSRRNSRSKSKKGGGRKVKKPEPEDYGQEMYTFKNDKPDQDDPGYIVNKLTQNLTQKLRWGGQ